MIRTLLALLLLLVAAFALACGDDDTDSGNTPTASSDASDPDDTGDAEESVEPTEQVTGNPSLSAEIIALRAEAAEVCPEEDVEACSDRYADFALGEDEMALCTDGERWFFEAPEGEVGDDCDNATTIAAIVGGED